MTPLESKWQVLKDQISSCQNCPWKDRKKQTVLPEGPLNAEVMLIGRNPGIQENSSGRPFYPTAPGGCLLNSFLEWIGLPREIIFISNIAKCQGQTPTERDPCPTPEVFQNCVHWVFEEMDLLKDSLKLVITLGNDAAYYVALQEESCLTDEGKIVKPYPNYPPIFIMSHVGLWLRQRSHIIKIREHVVPKLRRTLKSLNIKGLKDPNTQDLTEPS